MDEFEKFLEFNFKPTEKTREAELSNQAHVLRELYDSYLKVGFDEILAAQFTSIVLQESIKSGLRR